MMFLVYDNLPTILVARFSFEDAKAYDARPWTKFVPEGDELVPLLEQDQLEGYVLMPATPVP
jgi:hypothetical protein